MTWRIVQSIPGVTNPLTREKGFPTEAAARNWLERNIRPDAARDMRVVEG